MAQQIKNNTLGFLNKDDDERFIPKGDYNDALNIRRQLSSGGVSTPITNFDSNLLISNESLSSGTNEVIGQAVLEEVNSVFYFVWNSNKNHAIYQYDTITKVITKVVEDGFLNFQRTKYITGCNAFSNLDGEVLLYWTDNFNPPRKINVQRAILHNQGNFTSGYGANFSSGTNAQKAIYYDAVKHPPLNPLSFEFGIDPSRATNNIAGKVFQFRYRYIFDDGERSAYSPWSKLAISDKERLNDSIDSNSYDSTYNNVEITYETSDANNVVEIEFTFREGNTGDERLFATRSNDALLPVLNFYNDTVSPLVNVPDATKLYDAVPLLAQSQEIKDNVLFYGNTVDGFDLPTTTTGTRVVPEYNIKPLPDGSTVIPVTLVATNTIEIDFSSVVVQVGNFYNVDFNISGESSNLSPSNFLRNISGNYTAIQGDTVDSIMNQVFSQFNLNVIDRGNFLITFNGSVNTSLDKIFITVNDTSPSGGYSLSINDSASFFNDEPILGQITHKSGAYHPYGVVYYDRANRSSSVLKIGNPYVLFPTERDGNLKQLGRVGMSVFLDHTPPSWATHYQIVYAGNSSVDEYLQYTVSGVYKGKDISTSNNYDRIYLSLRNFRGSEESWKESTGALPDYNYSEGDRLRVLSYFDSTLNARVEPNSYLDFKVVGFDVLSASSAENPIITSADDATTRELKSGNFLILEDPKVTGFDVDTGSSQSTGLWFNSANDVGAYFEVYRPKRQTEDIPYYEVGEKYNILNAGTSSRTHQGGVRNQNASVSYTISSATVNTVTTLSSATDLIVGDNVNITDSGGNVILSTLIERLDINEATSTIYISGLLETPSLASSVVLTDTSAVTSVIGGDSWLKPRTFFTGNALSFNSVPVSVEDYYANDFIRNANSWDRGRPHVFSADARRVRRKATVWFSEPYFPQDDIYNGFSAFNLANLPYRDYDQSYGGIQVMKQNNEGIILWQEDKTSKILVDRNVIESAEGQASLTTNQEKLGIQVFYRGDYGIAQQPESLNGMDGIWYWMDIKRGKYLRLSLDGITPVSDYKMRNFFYDKSKSYLENYNQIKIIGGYDARNEESMITFPTITSTDVTTSSGDLLGDLGEAELNDATSALDISVDINVGNPNQLTYGNEDRTWSNLEEDWSDWGGNLYATQDISQTGSVDITSEQYDESVNSGIFSIPVYVNLNTTLGDFVTYSDLSIINGVLSVPSDSSAYPTLETVTTTAEDAFTVAFYEPANRWSTFYSFIPDYYTTINSLFITYDNARLYEHEASSSRKCQFYDVDYVSRFTPVVNDAPFDVKAFYALMIDGTTPLDVVATTNLNGTSMSGDDFDLKEGRYYGYLRGATIQSGDSAIIGLGEITAAGNELTVIGGSVASSGVFVGDTITNGTASTTITELNGNIITVTSGSGFSDSDFVYVTRPNIIEGDRIRGAYIQVECTITTADQNELQEIYSIDVEASKSYY